MTKKPEIKHEYHAKKDKLEITIHRYSLKSKSSRDAIMKNRATASAVHLIAKPFTIADLDTQIQAALHSPHEV